MTCLESILIEFHVPLMTERQLKRFPLILIQRIVYGQTIQDLPFPKQQVMMKGIIVILYYFVCNREFGCLVDWLQGGQGHGD